MTTSSSSGSTNILDLYTRIPDYSEVKHLGNSDFINTLEKLKEDFRRCRASLHVDVDVGLDSDIEYISNKTSKILNISQNQQDSERDHHRHHQSQNHSHTTTTAPKYNFQSQSNKSVNIIRPSFSSSNNNDHDRNYKAQQVAGSSSAACSNAHFYLPAKNNVNNNNNFGFSQHNNSHSSNSNENENENEEPTREGGQSQYLSVTSCELHKNPNDNLSASVNLRAGRSSNFFQSSQSQQNQYQGQFESRGNHPVPVYESTYAEDYELCESDNEGESVDGSVDSGLSRWSSSPEIYTRDRSRDKEFVPPSNVEQRLLIRRSQNNSAPSIPNIETKPPLYFKANPVPSHVQKPLFDLIMLKNKRRSMRVREKSKQKLLAQVKPFSFSVNPKQSKCTHNHQASYDHGFEYEIRSSERPEELLLNNSRPVKNRKSQRQHNGGLKTSVNKFGFNHYFKANPAPPRTKALLSAIRLKEQQDYRELKKRLRAEAMMKTASLPPSMAARDRRTKATLQRLDQILNRYNSLDNNLNDGLRRHLREGSAESFTFADEGRLTDAEESYLHGSSGRTTGPNSNPNVKISRPCTSKGTRTRRRSNFTPYGELRFPTVTASGTVFEATSNDNHASRLRVQVAREKELMRIKQEEEELMRSMKTDKKRQVLRNSHAQAWRLAGSYSSSQDIAMRRQLRQAAAILERESYKRDMSTMLTRVRSAPLLLEGLRERKFEPCKKHRDEMYGGKSRKRDKWGISMTKDDIEKSETAAMAEGSLTNSDNESTKNPELDYDEDENEEVEDECVGDKSNDKSSHDSGKGNNSKTSQIHHSNHETADHNQHHSDQEEDVDEDTYNVNDDDDEDFEEEVLDDEAV